MKVVALKPQFVIEAPPGEEAVSAKRVKRELKPVALAQPAQSSTDREADDRETRSGLTRLAEFIKAQRRSVEETKAAANAPGEKRVSLDSHEYTELLIKWQERMRTPSVATVLANELRRRKALQVYKKSLPARTLQIGDARVRRSC